MTVTIEEIEEAASYTATEDQFYYDPLQDSTSSTEEDETAEILADAEFAQALQESIAQADAGIMRRLEDIGADLGL